MQTSTQTTIKKDVFFVTLITLIVGMTAYNSFPPQSGFYAKVYAVAVALYTKFVCIY